MNRLACIFLAISILAPMALDMAIEATRDKSMITAQSENAARTAAVKWRAMTEAEARDYCLRPAHMITTLTQDCSRVPTAEKPYCPMP